MLFQKSRTYRRPFRIYIVFKRNLGAISIKTNSTTFLESFIVTWKVSRLQTARHQLHPFIDGQWLTPFMLYWGKSILWGHFELLFCCELMASKLCVQFVAFKCHTSGKILGWCICCTGKDSKLTIYKNYILLCFPFVSEKMKTDLLIWKGKPHQLILLLLGDTYNGDQSGDGWRFTSRLAHCTMCRRCQLCCITSSHHATWWHNIKNECT